jgi:hypothetical protein
MRALGRTIASGLVLTGLALAIAGGATVVFGQGRGEPAEGSMAALTAEVRALRLAVQQLAQTQSQTQALGVYLSVQQSRVLQVSSQLDAARRELDSLSIQATEMGSKLAELEEELPRISEPAQRNAMQDGIRGLRREHGTLSAREQQARNRELELSQSLQTEESRWSSLISRLEALTQR